MKHLVIVFLGLLLLCSGALYPWGSATHFYIDEQLTMKSMGLKFNAGYGGMAPDAFNYLFSSPYLENLYAATHYQFQPIWDKAGNRIAQALAFGFITHNDAWGADYTAHHAGITQGTAEGYVIAKAQALLVLAPLPPELPLSQQQGMSLYHEFVETAVNVLMKRVDPRIGEKIAFAALRRNPQFPLLLVGAYAEEFAAYFGGPAEATQAILAVEEEFRRISVLMGQVLCQEEAVAVQLFAEQMADMADDFLGAPLPIPRETAVSLVTQLIHAAMDLCAPDFQQEIEATIGQVALQMAAHGFIIADGDGRSAERVSPAEK
jgi:hypothetical protein